MIRENQRLLNQLHILTDGLMVFLAMLVSYWLRFGLFRGDGGDVTGRSVIRHGVRLRARFCR